MPVRGEELPRNHQPPEVGCESYHSFVLSRENPSPRSFGSRPACCAECSPLAQRIAARLRPNDLKADVSFLASDALQGRATPSPGLDMAAEYIAAQFRRAGLEPVGDDGYFQTANYVSVKPSLEGVTFSLGAMKTADGAVAIQEAVATDLKNAPAFKVSLSDGAAPGALTAEQIRGRVLLVEMPAGGGGRGGAGFPRHSAN